MGIVLGSDPSKQPLDYEGFIPASDKLPAPAFPSRGQRVTVQRVTSTPDGSGHVRAKVIDLIGGYGTPFLDPWNKQSWPVNTSLQLQPSKAFGVDDRRVPQERFLTPRARGSRQRLPAVPRPSKYSNLFFSNGKARSVSVDLQHTPPQRPSAGTHLQQVGAPAHLDDSDLVGASCTSANGPAPPPPKPPRASSRRSASSLADYSSGSYSLGRDGAQDAEPPAQYQMKAEEQDEGRAEVEGLVQAGQSRTEAQAGERGEQRESAGGDVAGSVEEAVEVVERERSCGETPAPAPAIQAGVDGDGGAGADGADGGGDSALDLSHDVILHRRTRDSSYLSTPNQTHWSRRQHRSLARVQGAEKRGESGERGQGAEFELSASVLRTGEGARGCTAQGSAPALLMMSVLQRRASLKEVAGARLETKGSKVGQGGSGALDALLTPVKGLSGSIIFNVIRDGEGLPVAYTPKPKVTVDRAEAEAGFRPRHEVIRVMATAGPHPPANSSTDHETSHVQAAASVLPISSPTSLSDVRDIRGEHAAVTMSLQELLVRRNKTDVEMQAARKQLPEDASRQVELLYKMLSQPTATRNRAQCVQLAALLEAVAAHKCKELRDIGAEALIRCMQTARHVRVHRDQVLKPSTPLLVLKGSLAVAEPDHDDASRLPGSDSSHRRHNRSLAAAEAAQAQALGLGVYATGKPSPSQGAVTEEEEGASISRAASAASASSASSAAVVKLQDAVHGLMLSKARWKVAVTAAEAQALASTSEEQRCFSEASLVGSQRLEQCLYRLKQSLAARAVDTISRRNGGQVGKVFEAMDLDRSQLLDMKELVSGFSRIGVSLKREEMEHTLLSAGFDSDANLSASDFRRLVRVMALNNSRHLASQPSPPAAAAEQQPQVSGSGGRQRYAAGEKAEMEGGMEEDVGEEGQVREMEEDVLYKTPHFIVQSESAELVTIDVLAAAQGALENRNAAVTGAISQFLSQHCGALSGPSMTPSILFTLASLATITTSSRGTQLSTQGQPMTHLHIIVTGQIVLTTMLPQAQPHELGQGGEKKLFRGERNAPAAEIPLAVLCQGQIAGWDGRLWVSDDKSKASAGPSSPERKPAHQQQQYVEGQVPASSETATVTSASCVHLDLPLAVLAKMLPKAALHAIGNKLLARTALHQKRASAPEVQSHGATLLPMTMLESATALPATDLALYLQPSSPTHRLPAAKLAQEAGGTAAAASTTSQSIFASHGRAAEARALQHDGKHNRTRTRAKAQQSAATSTRRAGAAAVAEASAAAAEELRRAAQEVRDMYQKESVRMAAVEEHLQLVGEYEAQLEAVELERRRNKVTYDFNNLYAELQQEQDLTRPRLARAQEELRRFRARYTDSSQVMQLTSIEQRREYHILLDNVRKEDQTLNRLLPVVKHIGSLVQMREKAERLRRHAEDRQAQETVQRLDALLDQAQKRMQASASDAGPDGTHVLSLESLESNVSQHLEESWERDAPQHFEESFEPRCVLSHVSQHHRSSHAPKTPPLTRGKHAVAAAAAAVTAAATPPSAAAAAGEGPWVVASGGESPGPPRGSPSVGGGKGSILRGESEREAGSPSGKAGERWQDIQRERLQQLEAVIRRSAQQHKALLEHEGEAQALRGWLQREIPLDAFARSSSSNGDASDASGGTGGAGQRVRRPRVIIHSDMPARTRGAKPLAHVRSSNMAEQVQVPRAGSSGSGAMGASEGGLSEEGGAAVSQGLAEVGVAVGEVRAAEAAGAEAAGGARAQDSSQVRDAAGSEVRVREAAHHGREQSESEREAGLRQQFFRVCEEVEETEKEVEFDELVSSCKELERRSEELQILCTGKTNARSPTEKAKLLRRK